MTKIITAFGIIAATILVATWAIGKPRDMRENNALARTRACQPDAGASTNITVTATSAGTAAALTNDTVHFIVCNTDVHWRMGDNAAPTAVTTDYLLKSGDHFPFLTGESVSNWPAAIRDSADGTCYIMECE